MAENSKELFKFSWTIENLSVWDYRRSMRSPSFMVESLGNAVFYLELLEKGLKDGSCSLYLYRAKNDEAPDQVKSYFQFESSTKKIKSTEVIFDKTKNIDSSWGYHSFIENARIFKVDDWFLLSGDVNIECIIYEADEKLGIDKSGPDVVRPEAPKNSNIRIKQSSARTRLKSEEISVKWNIEHFSKLTPEEKVTTEVFSFLDDSLRFLVALFVSPGGEVSNVEMSIENLRKPQQDPTFVACKVSYDDARGIRVSKTDKHVYDSNKNAIWKFPVLAEKKQLIPEEKDFLPKDILSLLLEFKICDGIEFSKAAKTVYGTISRPAKPRKQELTPLKENSLRMFREQQTCDVSFVTSTKTIRAHKFILFANSSVFRAMFDHETLEKQTNTIQVTDISFETLERFLAYLYIQRLEEEEMDAQLAMQLYFAADKYRVDSLKDRCSLFLKNNLQAGNVCDVMTLAERHQDDLLMDSVRLFCARHRAEILDSDEWKALSAERPQFALECLQRFCRM